MITEMQPHAFLSGGGAMGKLIRAKDWTGTVLGAPETWPQSLRTAVSIVLNSRFPMFVWWGSDLITIYNDAYVPIAGEKHPSLLGKSGREAWSEIWHDLSPLVQNVFNGISTWSEDQPLYMNRYGYTEETYFTFSYSPIIDDSGLVQGLFCACIETTDKVLAARRIQESERNLRNTILQSPVAMCIFKGPTYIVEIANDRMYQLWGREPGKIRLQPIFDALPEARNQGLEALLHRVFAGGETVVANERPVTLPRDGSVETAYLNFVYEPFRDGDGNISGVIGVATDVTEQVAARKKIEESEQELQLRVSERTRELENQRNLLDNILTNSSNGISVTEMIRNEACEVIDARTILANDAAVKFTGMPREIYLAKTATELDPNILQSAYGQECLKTLATGEPALIQYFLEFSGRWLELTISKMDDEHLIHIFTDITPVKETQLQLERMVEDLKQSNANLEEFAYAASHDMKEPIRKINFFSDRLKSELEQQLSENQLRLFGRLENAALRMGTLIDDLLAYSQTTKGITTLETIDLNKKLAGVLGDLELEIEQRQAAIRSNHLPTIQGNSRQLQQLFHNLISNALKYSKQNLAPQINFTYRLVKGREVKPELPLEEGRQQYHLISVEDNGIGFEQKDSERIFNVFTRLHGNAEYMGTGVGLAIARKVVHNHSGHIWAVSEPGKGTTFHVLLPVADVVNSDTGTPVQGNANQ
jgi:PAS domain S-box-containing protein